MTESEKKFISENCHVLKDHEIAAILSKYSGRRIETDSVRKARRALGIMKARGRGACEVRSRRLPDGSK